MRASQRLGDLLHCVHDAIFLKHGARMTHEQLILDIVSVLYVN